MILHLCQSVRGPLVRNGKREWKQMLKYVKRNDGTPFPSWESLRDAFLDELAKGHEVIPIGDPCEGFDCKKGCPGHPAPAEVRA